MVRREHRWSVMPLVDHKDAIMHRMPQQALRRRGPRRRAVHRAATRRTTLTLPAELLAQAEGLAAQRHQSVSAVVSGLLEEGMRVRQGQEQRGARVLELWRKAFTPLTEEEMALVDGIILE